MTKKVFIIFGTVFLTALFLVVFWRLKFARPSVETKFIQVVREQEAVNEKLKENSNEGYNGVQVKDAGSSASLSLPIHTYQTFNNCGPATLSMILAFSGVNVSQKELGEEMRPYQIPSGDNDDKTIFTQEFVDWAKKYGVESVGRVNGDIDLLKIFIANGIPVVVKTWLHMNEDIGHFRIVRGYDDERQIIIQDDSYEGKDKKIPYYDFLSMWQPFNYAYVIVYRLDQKELVEAIIGKELDVQVAWQNSLARALDEETLDSQNVYPVFNQSMAYYHLGDYNASIGAFERVEDRLPGRMLWYEIEPILAYQKQRNYDRVFQIIEEILTNGNRAFSELYQIRGEIYQKQDDKEKARGEFETALFYNRNFHKAKEALENL